VTSTYDDYPAPDFPSSSPSRNAAKARASGRASSDRPSDSGYSGSPSFRKPSEDRRRPSETEFTAGRKNEDTYRRPDDVFAGRIVGEESFSAALASRRKPSQDTNDVFAGRIVGEESFPAALASRRKLSQDTDDVFTGRIVGEESFSAALASRRKPSQDTTRKPDERDFGPRHSGAVSTPSETTSSLPGAQSTTATSAVIIPNKSTMEEEYIDIPYGRDGRDSGVTILDERERTRDGLGEDNYSASEYPSPMMNSRSPLVGLSGLSARLKGVEDDDELVAGNKSGDDLYDKYGRSSVDSTRSAGNNASNVRMATVRTAAPEDQEKLRRDYEYKIATMQTQITNLQRDLGDNTEHEKKRKESESRVKQLEEELASIHQVNFSLL
jgi:protein SPA2